MIKLAIEKQCRWVDERGRRHVCTNWDDCAGKSWYAMGDIRYCRYQVIWLIDAGLYVSVTGDIQVDIEQWPSQDEATGYTRAEPTQHSVNLTTFERPVEVFAELAARLARTGTDGRLLIHEVQSRRFENVAMLSREARSALGYASGWKRKRMGYSDWKKQRNRRRMKVKEIE